MAVRETASGVARSVESVISKGERMSIRHAATALAIAVVAPIAFVAGSAQAVQAPTSSITAVPSDNTPASGQTFRVSGLFIAQGKPADHLLVKMQSFTGGHWVQLSGAEMKTSSTGTYTMRLILQAKGDRTLRAVGVVPGPAHDAFKQFHVTVH
jgi:hypothetical protein